MNLRNLLIESALMALILGLMTYLISLKLDIVFERVRELAEIMRW